MRTFISISIPQELQQILANIQSELKLFPENRIAWVRPHQSHITLKFLGETTEEEISDISNCLIDIGKEFSPIQLMVAKAGGFPNLKSPRVIWIGVNAGVELDLLRNCIETDISTLGIKIDTKKYFPHITIGRIKQLDSESTMIEKLSKIQIPELIWMAKDINLMSRHQTPTGVLYKVLKAILMSSYSLI